MRARPIIFLAPLCLPGSALADVGHVADVAGHSHWIALGAIGLAAAIGLLGALGTRKGKDKGETETAGAETPEGEEAAA